MSYNIKKTKLSLPLSKGLLVVLMLIFISCSPKKENKKKYAGLLIEHKPRAIPMLRLFNNETILLDSSANKQLAAHKLFYDEEKRTLKVQLCESDTQKTISGYSPLNILFMPPENKCTVQLPDGTEILLNGSTKLFFDNIHITDNRCIIDGEAYIKKQTPKDHPRVLSPMVCIEYCIYDMQLSDGEYNIKGYTRDTLRTLSVINGKATLIDPFSMKRFYFKKGNQVILKSHSCQSVLYPHIEYATAWMNNIFKLDGKSLEEVLKDFSKWYGFEYKMVEKIKDSCAGEIRMDQFVTYALQELESSRRVHFNLIGDSVYVYKNRGETKYSEIYRNQPK